MEFQNQAESVNPDQKMRVLHPNPKHKCKDLPHKTTEKQETAFPNRSLSTLRSPLALGFRGILSHTVIHKIIYLHTKLYIYYGTPRNSIGGCLSFCIVGFSIQGLGSRGNQGAYPPNNHSKNSTIKIPCLGYRALCACLAAQAD